MDSYMASNGPCFMASWTIFKNRLLEVGLPQTEISWHSKTSQPFTYHTLSCVRTPHEHRFIEMTLG